MQKYTKIQASVQHGLYLFTCEIHSFNSTHDLLTTQYLPLITHQSLQLPCSFDTIPEDLGRARHLSYLNNSSSHMHKPQIISKKKRRPLFNSEL